MISDAEIAGHLGIDFDHEDVAKVQDALNRYLVHQGYRNQKVNAETAMGEVHKIATAANKLVYLLKHASPEARRQLGIPRNAHLNLDYLEDWAVRVSDAAHGRYSTMRGADSRSRRDQLWRELADIGEKHLGRKLSKTNPEGPLNLFISSCCRETPGAEPRSPSVMYKAISQ